MQPCGESEQISVGHFRTIQLGYLWLWDYCCRLLAFCYRLLSQRQRWRYPRLV
ncbi:MAG TPA: hypothetical protein D7H81_02595 [Candidatus Poseidoniales archaeon]|nr:MAG TPA: hypothetical protein D7H81_02595 [Candidatus Poseidoniales archaeon]